jgi:hypothetical protein
VINGRNRERERSSWESVRGGDGSDTCKKASQPGSKAGITQRKSGGAMAFVDTAVLPLARWPVLTVYIRIKLQVDLQADKSSVVVKGPFFP